MTESGFAPAEGTRLWYEVAGEGPAVVLVHGRGPDHRMWSHQADAFQAAHRLVRYDLRGFGRSAPGEVPYSHGDDLAALLDHLGIERAALVGCSLGGGAAVNFAVSYSDRVSAFVPVGSSLGGWKWSEPFNALFREAARIAREQGPKAGNEHYLTWPIFDGVRNDPAAMAGVRALIADYDGAHWVEPDRGRPLVPPAIERLGSVTAPALVLVGEHDAPDFLAIAACLAERLPDARHVVLDGLGHLPMLEDPTRFNRVVLDFLAAAGA